MFVLQSDELASSDSVFVLSGFGVWGVRVQGLGIRELVVRGEKSGIKISGG